MKFNKKFLAILLSASLVISGCGVEKGNPGSSQSSPIYVNMAGTNLTFQNVSINSSSNLTYSNNATQYLDGTGNWTVPAGGAGSSNHTHSPGNITGGTPNQTIISDGTRGQWFTPVVAWISDYASNLTNTLANYVTNVLFLAHTNNTSNPHNTTINQVVVPITPNPLTVVGQRLTMGADGNVTWQPPSFAGAYKFYFQNTSANYSNYKQLIANTIELTKTTNTTAGVTNNQTLATFITNQNVPNLVNIPAGSFEFHIHASQTAGTQTTTLHAEIWETAANGTDIARIGMAEPTSTLTGAELEYDLVFVNNNPYTFNSTSSRVLVRIHAIVSGGGTAPTINLYWGGLADAFVAFPSITVNVNNFVATANVTTTPTANLIPAANASGIIDPGWITHGGLVPLFSPNITVTAQNETKIAGILPMLNASNITAVGAWVSTNSTSGNVTVNIYSIRLAAIVATIYIDVNKGSSYTSATAPIIYTANSGLQTGDILRFDVIYAGTGAKGLQVGFQTEKR